MLEVRYSAAAAMSTRRAEATTAASGNAFALREETIGRRARCPDMCKQCKEIDAKIAHYQRVAERITDQTTIAGLKATTHTRDGPGRGRHRTR